MTHHNSVCGLTIATYYRTHLIKVVKYGNSLTQETYSKKSNNYMTIKSKLVSLFLVVLKVVSIKLVYVVASQAPMKPKFFYDMNSHLVVKDENSDTHDMLGKQAILQSNTNCED